MEEDSFILNQNKNKNIIKWKKIKWIEPVLFLYNLYFVGSLPIVSQLVKHLIELKYKNLENNYQNPRNFELNQNKNKSIDLKNLNENKTINDLINSESSIILIYTNMGALLPAFLVTIIFGGMSDYHGRINVIIMSLVGASLRLVTIMATYIFKLNIYFLVLSSILDGLLGMSCLVVMGCYMYLSDITSHQQRSFRTVCLEVSGGLGTIFSYVGSGLILEKLGFNWIFIIMLFIVFINILYVTFFLQESMPIRPQAPGLISTPKFFIETIKIYTEKDLFSSRGDKLFILFLFFLFSSIQLASQNAETLFMLRDPFSFDSRWIGYFNSEVFLISSVISWLVTRLFGRCLGDLGLVFIGFLSSIGYYIFFAFSTTKLWLLLVPIAGCCNFLPIPILRSMASKMIPPDQIGLMFASLAWIQLLGILSGGIIQNEIYSFSVSSFSSLVFLIDSGAIVFGLIIFIIYIIRKKLKNNQAQYDVIGDY